MASSIKAGEAFVEILARTSSFEKGLLRAQTKLKNFSATALKTGAKLSGLFAGLSAPLALSINKFATFEEGLSKVGSLIGFDTKLMKEFKDSIQGLSTEFGDTTASLVAGLFDIISSGKPAADAIEILRNSTKLAAAGFTTTAIATQALTRIMDAYSISVDGAAKITDQLIAITNVGVTDLEKFAPVIGRIASKADVLNISFSELGAAFAAISKDVSTNETITALGGIMKAFIKPSKEAAKLAREFGIEMSVSALRSEGFVNVMRKIAAIPKDSIGKIFPDESAITGIIALSKNMTLFEQSVSKIENSGGTVNKTIEEVSKNLAFMGRQIRSLGGVLLEVIGEALADDVKGFAKTFSTVVKTILDFAKANKEVVRGVALGVLAIGALAAGFITLGLASGAIAFVFGGIASLVGGLVTVLSLLATKAAIVSIGIGVLGVVFEKQFGLISKAIDAVKARFLSFKNVAESVMTGVVNAIKQGNLVLALEIVGKGLEVVWQTAWNKLVNITMTVRATIIKLIADAFESVASIAVKIFGNMEIAAAHFVSFFEQVFAGAALFVNNQIETLASGFARLGAVIEKAFNPNTFDLSEALDLIDSMEKQNKAGFKAQANKRILEAAGLPSEARDKMQETLKDIKDLASAVRDHEDKAVKDAVLKGNSKLDKLKDELAELVKSASPKKDPKWGAAIGYGNRGRTGDKDVKNKLPKPVLATDRFEGFDPFKFERRVLKDKIANETLDEQKKANKLLKNINKNIKDGGRMQ